MEVPIVSLQRYFELIAAGKNLSSLEEDGDSALGELVAKLRNACEHVGFFVVVDHGVDVALLEAQRQHCAGFFASPPQSCIIDMLRGDEGRRFAWLDYVPGDTNGSSAEGSWSLGPVDARGSMAWQPHTEEMRSTWLAYYAAMESLTAVLLRLLALALGLSADTFDEALRGHGSALRAILYPEVSEAELETAADGAVVRSGVHTDWGCLTILLADATVAGLELQDRQGVWAPLRPVPPGGLVVNLGDLLPYWTNGHWVGTPHRVVARKDSRARRLSVPYFGLVNRSTILAPLCAPAKENEALAGDAADDASESCAAKLTAGEFFDNHAAYVAKLWRK